MKLSVLAIGRLKGAERELCDRYGARLAKSGRPLGLDWRGVTEAAESRVATATERMNAEADTLLSCAGTGAIIALDERGDTLASEAFAGLIAKQRDCGVSNLAFAIGGPDGHGEALLERATARIALGRMTWPHGLARAMLLEQLYRATTILSGHPYHRA